MQACSILNCFDYYQANSISSCILYFTSEKRNSRNSSLRMYCCSDYIYRFFFQNTNIYYLLDSTVPMRELASWEKVLASSQSFPCFWSFGSQTVLRADMHQHPPTYIYVECHFASAWLNKLNIIARIFFIFFCLGSFGTSTSRQHTSITTSSFAPAIIIYLQHQRQYWSTHACWLFTSRALILLKLYRLCLRMNALRPVIGGKTF